MSGAAEERDGVSFSHLDQELFDGAGATKRDLVDYLEAVAERMLPGLADRPLSVIRVRPGQPAFMQKNLPKYTPDWIARVPIWAEASKREVSYPLANDHRTLLWFANQRAVEYHVTLFRLGHWDEPDYLVMDLDPPEGAGFPVAARRRTWCGPRWPRRVCRGRQRPAGPRVCTYSSRWPPASLRRMSPPPPERSQPGRNASTRSWRRRHSSRRNGTARCSWIRPEPAAPPSWRPTVRGSDPACRCRSRWPGTSSTGWRRPTSPSTPAPGLLGSADPWRASLPEAQRLPDELVAEGHEIPIARVQAMHEGKRRARERRT